MGLLEWFQGREPWEQLLLVGVPGLGVGIGVAYVVDRLREASPPSGGYTPYDELPEVLDFEHDQVDEPPPPGIEYDQHDAPCVDEPEPGPDPAPVAYGLDAESFCTPPADLEPKQRTEVPFAVGGDRPIWPIDTNARRKLQVSYQDVRGKWHGRWGREFGASRRSKSGRKRRHVAVDLFADPGDVVVATEPGEVLAALPFYKGTGALYLLTDSGIIINYGELERNSWRKFGATAGTRVQAGDELGRVGLAHGGSHMLHLEIYEPDVTIEDIRKGKMQWYKGEPPPEGMLDPTRYLVRAQRVHHEDQIT